MKTPTPVPCPAPIARMFCWLPGLCWLASFCVAGKAPAQTPGSLDTTFNAGASGLNNAVNSVAIQSSGKIVAGGSFTNVSGLARIGSTRLNADGSVDAAFNPGTTASTVTVYSVAMQSDGKTLVGGLTYDLNFQATGYLVRLNASGGVDTTFVPGTGPNNSVNDIALQSDGKILVAGNFTAVKGVTRNRVARLNADGSLDTTFAPGTGANATVYSVAVQSDGKIVIGGSFTTANGVARNYIARLNGDGSLDTTFNPATGANAIVNSLAVQSDGKIVVGGAFTTFNSVTRNRVARLNADGSLDTTFDPGAGANAAVNSVGLQSGDGKILLGGAFTTINEVGRNRIARLNINGSLDTAFAPGTGANNTVSDLTVQSDGKVVVGGAFTAVSDAARNYLARLNADGTLDTAFNANTGANAAIADAAIQSNGKIVVGGSFTSINSTVIGRVARLNADGSLDTAFNPGTGANGTVSAVAVQTDGKVVIGGSFTTVNGVGRVRIARLNADGSLDTTFAPGTGANGTVYSVAVQTDGKIVVGDNFYLVNGVSRYYVARLNADGSVDTAFNPGSGANDYVYSVAVQSDGKIVVGGYFSTFNSVARQGTARLNTDGSLDTTFNTSSGYTDGPVYSVVAQANGKVVIGGGFLTVNDVGREYVARLNANGSVDTAFDTSDGPSNIVHAVAVQSDGKVLIGGEFSTVGSAGAIYRLARLNADGSLDTAFDAGTGPNDYPLAVKLQSDGKVLVAGRFNYLNGTSAAYIVRLYGTAVVAAAPSVAAGGADTLQTMSAVVRASVNPQGAATTVSFQYGTTTGYGSTTSAQSIGSGTSAVAVSATLSGLTPGTLYHYRAIATNSVGTTNGADATFTTLTVAEGWRQQYFGTSANTGTAADTADPDGDGVVNLLERALGLNPTQASRTGLPTTTRDTATGKLTLTAAKGTAASDLMFSAEASADLVNWTTTGVTVLQNTSTTFQARDDGAATGASRRFLRLRVTAP